MPVGGMGEKASTSEETTHDTEREIMEQLRHEAADTLAALRQQGDDYLDEARRIVDGTTAMLPTRAHLIALYWHYEWRLNRQERP